MKLFPKMELAVKAMALCCPDKKDDGDKTIHDDINKSPIARSEVFNETWMLRLTLALIHDCVEGFEDSTLARIHKAVTKRWISEGGLEPAFEEEGTTWTDAILGDVRLRGESAANNEKAKTEVNKRKIELADISNNNASVVIVEAKMGSELASGITHADDYNQAARNIACLATLLMKTLPNKNAGEALAKNSAFYVFAPKSKIMEWIKSEENPKDPNTMIKHAWETINKQKDARDRDGKRGGKNQARTPNVDDIGELEPLVNSIISNSKVISWEEIIESMQKADTTGACETLKWFYEETCAEYGIEPSWSKT